MQIKHTIRHLSNHSRRFAIIALSFLLVAAPAAASIPPNSAMRDANLYPALPTLDYTASLLPTALAARSDASLFGSIMNSALAAGAYGFSSLLDIGTEDQRRAGAAVLSNLSDIGTSVMLYKAGLGPVFGTTPETLFEATAPLKQNIFGNILESRRGREASNFELYAAKEAQIMGGYTPDIWEFSTLNRGSIVYGGLPGQSNFYTDYATVRASGLNADNLFESLQVAPHPVYGYRQQIGAYRVLENMEVPSGNASANPSLGAGGGRQFWIQNYERDLKLIHTFNLTTK